MKSLGSEMGGGQIGWVCAYVWMGVLVDGCMGGCKEVRGRRSVHGWMDGCIDRWWGGWLDE